MSITTFTPEMRDIMIEKKRLFDANEKILLYNNGTKTKIKFNNPQERDDYLNKIAKGK